MIVWYAKGLSTFGTINLFMIPVAVLILLIGLLGLIGALVNKEILTKYHSFGCIFGTVFLFCLFMIYSLPGFFTGASYSGLYYDGVTGLLFAIITIPVGAFASISSQMYLKALENENNSRGGQFVSPAVDNRKSFVSPQTGYINHEQQYIPPSQVQTITPQVNYVPPPGSGF